MAYTVHRPDTEGDIFRKISYKEQPEAKINHN